MILDHVSGFVEPGPILVIMGPSGNGKSTILYALADRVELPVEGLHYANCICLTSSRTSKHFRQVDGSIKTPHALKAAAKYVRQTNELLGVLTVKETLDVVAGLYIDATTKRSLAVTVVRNFLVSQHMPTRKLAAPSCVAYPVVRYVPCSSDAS